VRQSDGSYWLGIGLISREVQRTDGDSASNSAAFRRSLCLTASVMGDLALNERNTGAASACGYSVRVVGLGSVPVAPDLRCCSQLSVLRRCARPRNSFITGRPGFSGCCGIEGVSLGDVTFDGRPPSLTIHCRCRLLCSAAHKSRAAAAWTATVA